MHPRLGGALPLHPFGQDVADGQFGKDGQGVKELKMVKLVEKAEYGRIVYDLLSMTYVQSLAT